MMIPLLTAMLVATTPEQAIRDEAKALGREFIMGQVCEALEVVTLKDDAFIAWVDDLNTRAVAANLSTDIVDDAANEGYTAAVAELEALYPTGSEEEAHTELTATCQELITTRPALYSAFAGD